jgi:hypothetical protein
MWTLHVTMIAQAKTIIASTSRACSRSRLNRIATPTHAGSPPRSYRINSQSPPPHPSISLAIRTDDRVTSSRISHPFLSFVSMASTSTLAKETLFRLDISFCPQYKHRHGIYQWETEIMREKEETTPCLPLFLRCFGKIPINRNYWQAPPPVYRWSKALACEILPPASPRPSTGLLYDQPANCCCIV